MKNKLKLEDIAHYLPYGLHLLSVNKTVGVETESCVVKWTMNDINQPFNKRYKVKLIKPILHPLSEYGGNMAKREIINILKCSYGVVDEIWEYTDEIKTLNEISYETYTVMCRNHIDFNNLIGQGLAVDVKAM